MRASLSLSRAGAGVEPRSSLPPPPGLERRGRNGDPPGEGLRANAAGRLPRSPSPRPPPAPPAASAAARRSSAAFPAQSVSPRRWVSGGRSGRGWGMQGGGIPKGRSHVQGSPTPTLPRLSGILLSGAQGVGAPRGKREELSRVLTAEWPARRNLVSAASERPLQEGPRARCSPSAGRAEAGAQGESCGQRFREGLRGGLLRLSHGPFPFWRLGVFSRLLNLLPSSFPSLPIGRGNSGWQRRGALEDLSCPAYLSTR